MGRTRTSGDAMPAMDAASMNSTTAVTSAMKATCTPPTMEAAATAPSESIVGNEADGKQDKDRKGSQKITKHGISSIDRGAATRSSVMPPHDRDRHPTIRSVIDLRSSLT